tara:strand:+ start:851 stop:1120 length:270 start_codon:yes stop_codon:yes gene_type:complete
LVKEIIHAETAIGKIDYTLTDKQKKGRDFTRSLYVVQDMKKGEIVSTKNVRNIIPGFRLHPKYYFEILGKKVKFDLKLENPLSFNQIEE